MVAAEHRVLDVWYYLVVGKNGLDGWQLGKFSDWESVCTSGSGTTVFAIAHTSDCSVRLLMKGLLADPIFASSTGPQSVISDGGHAAEGNSTSDLWCLLPGNPSSRNQFSIHREIGVSNQSCCYQTSESQAFASSREKFRDVRSRWRCFPSNTPQTKNPHTFCSRREGNQKVLGIELNSSHRRLCQDWRCNGRGRQHTRKPQQHDQICYCVRYRLQACQLSITAVD